MDRPKLVLAKIGRAETTMAKIGLAKTGLAKVGTRRAPHSSNSSPLDPKPSQGDVPRRRLPETSPGDGFGMRFEGRGGGVKPLPDWLTLASFCVVMC